MSGFVYFLRCGNFVKVGFSATPNVRIGQLKTASPHDLDVVAVLPGTRDQEAAVHSILASVHHRREWFRDGSEVEAVLREGLPHVDRRFHQHPVVPVIDSWPSIRAFANDAGVSYGAAKQMRRRHSIPAPYWFALTSSETGRRLGITVAGLLAAHTKQPELAR